MERYHHQTNFDQSTPYPLSRAAGKTALFVTRILLDPITDIGT